jgi:hypothetical protein
MAACKPEISPMVGAACRWSDREAVEDVPADAAPGDSGASSDRLAPPPLPPLPAGPCGPMPPATETLMADEPTLAVMPPEPLTVADMGCETTLAAISLMRRPRRFL